MMTRRSRSGLHAAAFMPHDTEPTHSICTWNRTSCNWQTKWKLIFYGSEKNNLSTYKFLGTTELFALSCNHNTVECTAGLLILQFKYSVYRYSYYWRHFCNIANTIANQYCLSYRWCTFSQNGDSDQQYFFMISQCNLHNRFNNYDVNKFQLRWDLILMLDPGKRNTRYENVTAKTFSSDLIICSL